MQLQLGWMWLPGSWTVCGRPVSSKTASTSGSIPVHLELRTFHQSTYLISRQSFWFMIGSGCLCPDNRSFSLPEIPSLQWAVDRVATCLICRFRDRFGTISGFRLGRWKEEVKWPEVNSAWGQAVLLLDMMTRMYPDFKWEQGMLKPMGSHSMVRSPCLSQSSSAVAAWTLTNTVVDTRLWGMFACHLHLYW